MSGRDDRPFRSSVLASSVAVVVLVAAAVALGWGVLTWF